MGLHPTEFASLHVHFGLLNKPTSHQYQTSVTNVVGESPTNKGDLSDPVPTISTSRPTPIKSNNTMPSQTLLSLLTLVLSAATCQAGLRGTPTTITDSSSSLTLRITRSVDLLRQENGEFTHDHHQLLSIPIENGQETGAFHSIELPQDIVTEYEDRIATGELFVSIPSEHATLPGDHIILSDPTVVSVLDHVPISTRRRRLGRVDTRKVAVLRVSMGGGPADKRQVAYSATQIRQQIFERSMSLKGQVENCSNGSMQINEGGVYEVTVPGAFTDFPAPAHLRNRALELFAQQLGVSSANNQFDHVIVILPPNDFAGFVGNAGGM